MLRKIFLALLFLCAVSISLSAQNTEEQAKDDLDYYNDDNNNSLPARRSASDDFGSKIWYGTGAQLGFNSNQFESFFQIGLSPIVGYKINEILSVGPRGSFAYNAYRQVRGGGDDFKAKFWTWSVGGFVRGKVFNQFFAHAEYSLLGEVESFDSNGDPIRQIRAIPFLGGGISQGGGPSAPGFEILILFRLSQPDRIGDSPFEFRTGFNYNF